MELHRASEICETFLDERGVKLDEEHPDFDLHQVCTEVIHFMKVSGWMADDGPWLFFLTRLFSHDDHSSAEVNNAALNRPYLKSFPHHFLRNPAQHGSLSVLSKTWLFTGICSRLGLDAFPTRLPSKETVCCVRSSDMPLCPVVVDFSQRVHLVSGGVSDKRKDGTSLLTEGELGQYLVPLHPCVFIDEARRDFVNHINRWYPNDANALIPGHNVSADEKLRVVHAIGCFLTATHNLVSDWGGNPSLFLMGPIAEALPLDGDAVILNTLFPPDEQVPPACFVPVAELHDALRRADDVNSPSMCRGRLSRSASRHSVGEIVYESETNKYGCITGWQVSCLFQSTLCRWTTDMGAAPARARNKQCVGKRTINSVLRDIAPALLSAR